jgi:Type I phosphodiesterase / nucleotide pyrophosphatase
MERMRTAFLGFTLACLTAIPAFAQPSPHNVVLFVADGLRPGMVNEETTPAMAALMKDGVSFANAHSMFPTLTMANASAMATGHKLGDTGTFSNTIDAGFAVPAAGNSLTPFLGRELNEAMPDGNMPNWKTLFQISEADPAGHRTIVQTQLVGDTHYFDAAGYEGRTLGLIVPEAGSRDGE